MPIKKINIKNLPESQNYKVKENLSILLICLWALTCKITFWNVTETHKTYTSIDSLVKRFLSRATVILNCIPWMIDSILEQSSFEEV